MYKIKNKYVCCIWLAIIGLMTGGCSDADTELDQIGDNTPLTVIGTISAASRASDASWAPGDMIGVAVKTSPSYKPKDLTTLNHCYITEKGDGIFEAFSSDDLFFALANQTGLFISAYYPYIAERNLDKRDVTTSEPLVITDQTDVKKHDFLFYNNAKGFAVGTTLAKLTFKHSMALLTVKVSGKDGKNLKDYTVKLFYEGLSNEYRVNFITCECVAVTGGQAPKTEFALVEGPTENQDYYLFSAMLPPQEIGGKLICELIDSDNKTEEYIGNLTGALWNSTTSQFTAGTNYNLNADICITMMRFSDPSITDWDKQEISNPLGI